MGTREPRADSVLGNLPKEQQDQLDFWLFDERPKPLAKVILERIRERFGVTVAASTLSAWKKRRKEDRIIDQITEKAKVANAAMDAVGGNEEVLRSATRRMVEMFALELGARALSKAHNDEDGDYAKLFLQFVDRALRSKRR